MKEFRDEIAEICHEIVEDGYSSGKVTEAEMKEFVKDCFIKNHSPVGFSLNEQDQNDKNAAKKEQATTA